MEVTDTDRMVLAATALKLDFRDSQEVGPAETVAKLSRGLLNAADRDETRPSPVVDAPGLGLDPCPSSASSDDISHGLDRF